MAEILILQTTRVQCDNDDDADDDDVDNDDDDQAETRDLAG